MTPFWVMSTLFHPCQAKIEGLCSVLECARRSSLALTDVSPVRMLRLMWRAMESVWNLGTVHNPPTPRRIYDLLTKYACKKTDTV